MSNEIFCDRCKKRIDLDDWGNCDYCEDDLCIDCAGRWNELPENDEHGGSVCDRCFAEFALFSVHDVDNDMCIENDVDPVGWKSITNAMESIRDKIGDLMDTLGEIAAESDPRASEITDADRQMLGTIQHELYRADSIILSAKPSRSGKSIESP